MSSWRKQWERKWPGSTKYDMAIVNEPRKKQLVQSVDRVVFVEVCLGKGPSQAVLHL